MIPLTGIDALGRIYFGIKWEAPESSGGWGPTAGMTHTQAAAQCSPLYGSGKCLNVQKEGSRARQKTSNDRTVHSSRKTRRSGIAARRGSQLQEKG